MEGNKVSKSIFSKQIGIESVIIPMAEVIAIEKEQWQDDPVRIKYTVILKNGQIVLKYYMLHVIVELIKKVSVNYN